MNLEEIRLRESAPNIGVPVYANRRETSSFQVGTDNVKFISLEGEMITVVTEREEGDKVVTAWLGMPASACRWWKFGDPEPEVKPKASKSRAEKAA